MRPVADSVSIPAAGAWVEIDLGEGTGEHRTMIESVDGLDLLLVPATYSRYLTLPGAGTAVALSWTAERGRFTAPGEFAGVERSVTPARWRITLTGSFSLDQRREFARVAVDELIRVTVESSGRTVPDTRTVDLGEGGVRIRCADASSFAVRDRVYVRLLAGIRLLALHGEVVRMVRARDGSWEAIIIFSPEEEPAEQIRRFVLTKQVADRAERLGIVGVEPAPEKKFGVWRRV